MRSALLGLWIAIAGCQEQVPAAPDAEVSEIPDAATDAPVDDGDAALAVLATMERVADWQITALDGNDSATWEEATFYAGLVATYTATGELRFFEDLFDWADHNAWTPRVDRMHPDNQCAGQAYVELHALDGVAAHLAGTRQVMDQALAQDQAGREVWWWCDALFMAPTVLARLGAVTGDSRYVDALNERWWDVYDALYDPDHDLFSRDAGYLDAHCPNGEKMFWSRGNAWVVAGTVRVLQYLPVDHPARSRYLDLLRRMVARLASLQRPDGFWSSCLTDAVAYPEPETSGTSGFVYAMAWGVNEGVLDRATYLPVIRRGWQALLGAVDESGRLHWVQDVGAAPATTTADDTHAYGVGLFLLAASEVVELAGDLR